MKFIKKDKNLRHYFKKFSIQYFLLKLILKNKNIFMLNKFKALVIIKQTQIFVVAICDKCIVSFNKKKYNKLTNYSRIILLKKIYSNECIGFQKSLW